MTSVEEFNCILCKETFDNKDELQIHFRKHGDPKFNESIKAKSRVQSETPSANEKSNDASEMVNCDVCDEVFPTISKAITHKHKVHPDHDAKYFCPWCGKLFTMKHLYNKHMNNNHDGDMEVPENKDSHFHCDSCAVYFYIPSAMVYHNKFFHRQDTDLPIIGHSKKQKMVNQDLLPVYYCSFCGEEYINKVNLHKHMCDDHGDENQRPTDVLRCPLCEAVFYHLDAYELHLTFHSSEDLYSETTEMNEQEMTEFSLDTVPPVMERIEDLNNLPNVETSMNSLGIESFLQMAMDEPTDGNQPGKVKSKKHKKHKKSKKSAITLDEFLNMNQDVFGENLDFQGIEVVPTKVITKHLKVKKTPIPKPGAKLIPSADLQKLQKLGIDVKVQSGNGKKPISKVKPIGQPIKVSPQVKNLTNHTKTNTISASNDVLSKLLSQGSSQLKIVKKSAQEKSPGDESDASELTAGNLDERTPSESKDTKSDEDKNNDNIRSNTTQVNQTSPTSNQADEEASVTAKSEDIVNKNLLTNSGERNNACDEQSKSSNVNHDRSAGNYRNDSLKNIGNQITITSLKKHGPRIEDTSETSQVKENPVDQNCLDLNADQKYNLQEKHTIDTLNLNCAITIKSLKNNSASAPNNDNLNTNDKTERMFNATTTLSQISTVHSHSVHSQSSTVEKSKLGVTADNVYKCDKIRDQHVHKVLPSQVVHNISKNITIKSMPPIKHPMGDFDDHCDSDFDPDNDLPTGDQFHTQSFSNKSSSQVIQNIIKNVTIKPTSPVISQPKGNIRGDENNDSDFDPDDDLPIDRIGERIKGQCIPLKPSSSVLQNVSKNITIKSISPQIKHKNKEVTSDGQNDLHFDHPKDDDINKGGITKQPTTSAHVLKNISKNVTVKSIPPMEKQLHDDVPIEEHGDSDFGDFEDDTLLENQSSHSEVTSALDKLKNINPSLKIKPGVGIKSTVNSPNGNNATVVRVNKNTDNDDVSAKNIDFGHTKSSNNILQNLKNITAKPVVKNKSISQAVFKSCSYKPSNTAKDTSAIPKSVQTKEVPQDIEIFNIDDSEDEEEQLKVKNMEPVIKKEPIKANVNSPAVLNAIKNMSKHLTVKPSHNQATQKLVKKEESTLEYFSEEHEMHDDRGQYYSNNYFEHDEIDETSHNHPKSILNIPKNKNDSYNNVLKQLSKHITVKSNSSFPSQWNKSVNQAPKIHQDTANDIDSDEESYPGKVKITDITEEEDVDHATNSENEGVVTQSPEDTNSDDEQFTKEMEDVERSRQNVNVKMNENVNPSSQCLLKNISKNITVKSLNEKTANLEDKSCNPVLSNNEIIANQSSLCKELVVKQFQQNNPDNTNDNENATTSNMPNNKPTNCNTARQNSPSGNPLITKQGQANTFNKEIKVKTFQSETVIEEITTTVTKTIRRVNQTTVNQQVLNASQTPAAPRMIRPKTGPRMGVAYSNNSLKGVTVRQPSPRAVRPNIRQAVPVRLPASTVVRPANQLVPVRLSNQLVPVRPSNQLAPVRPSNQLVPIRPGITPIRASNAPRMQVKNMPRQPRPVGKPLKMSPNVLTQTLKRPFNEEIQGHFSCFKKPKESLIPGNESALETSSDYASTTQTSKFCSTSQTIKDNTVVTSTQMKSETMSQQQINRLGNITSTQMKTASVSQQQQINRLGNISGLKVAKTSQVNRVETTEMSASKRQALEAIEKLQKQGLLIKKPRAEDGPEPSNDDGTENEELNDYDYDD